MPNRSSNKQRPEDINEAAFRVFQEAIGEAPPKPIEAPKNAAAVELGRLGGRKGGAARAATSFCALGIYCLAPSICTVFCPYY